MVEQDDPSGPRPASDGGSDPEEESGRGDQWVPPEQPQHRSHQYGGANTGYDPTEPSGTEASERTPVEGNLNSASDSDRSAQVSRGQQSTTDPEAAGTTDTGTDTGLWDRLERREFVLGATGLAAAGAGGWWLFGRSSSGPVEAVEDFFTALEAYNPDLAEAVIHPEGPEWAEVERMREEERPFSEDTSLSVTVGTIEQYQTVTDPEEIDSRLGTDLDALQVALLSAMITIEISATVEDEQQVEEISSVWDFSVVEDENWLIWEADEIEILYSEHR